MEQEERKSLTSEANRIMLDEIAPLITKMFASITSELMNHPRHWEDADGSHRKVYDKMCLKCKEFFEGYTEGTARLMYEELCKPPVTSENSLDSLSGIQ